MPRAGFFAQIGMFAAPRFLAHSECADLQREMQSSPRDAAQILSNDYHLNVDRDWRRTEIARVSPETRSWVTARLMDAKPALEKHFAVELTRCEPPSFLVYGEGSYYGRHVDANPDSAAPAQFRERRVSVSVFVNGEGIADGSYRGGSLTFYGASGAPATPGLALTGEEGLLIGFTSNVLHEVKPIQSGTRYSIVTWFG